jgi:hypothetical protein
MSPQAVRPILRWLATMAGAAALVAVGLAAGGAAPAPPAPQAQVPDGGAPSPTVKVIFQTVPPEKALVYWGKKSIGIINPQQNAKHTKSRSLILERPRDSGPMDVVVRAKDFLPVHIRAYTFTDTKVFVKLTAVEEKKSLFGYREEIPDAGLPEAGAPPMVGPPAPADAGAR